jgi:hypothetical protein
LEDSCGDKRLAEGAGSPDARGTKSAEVPASGTSGSLWHALRHTYASLCVAAALSGLEVSRFMGHSKPTTTLAIYTHLFNTDDHAGAMAALGAMAPWAKTSHPDLWLSEVPNLYCR